MEEYFKIGVVSSTHGVHGEFKVFPTTDDVHRFSDLKEVEIRAPKKTFMAEIENVKYFKQFAILKIKGYDSLNDIENLLKGAELYVDRAHAVPLEPGEYYIADLLDMEVYKDDGERLGRLDDVIQTGANDVYDVIADDGKHWLLPKIPSCVLDVDVEAGKMTVHLLPGLEDL